MHTLVDATSRKVRLKAVPSEEHISWRQEHAHWWCPRPTAVEVTMHECHEHWQYRERWQEHHEYFVNGLVIIRRPTKAAIMMMPHNCQSPQSVYAYPSAH